MQTKHEFILLSVLPYDFEKKFHIQKIMCGSVHVHIYQGLKTQSKIYSWLSLVLLCNIYSTIFHLQLNSY